MEPLVRIRWRDAFFDFDTHEAERTRDYVVTTVGHLIARDDLFVTLAAEVLPDGDGYRAVSRIPIPLIVEERLLADPDEAPSLRTVDTA